MTINLNDYVDRLPMAFRTRGGQKAVVYFLSGGEFYGKLGIWLPSGRFYEHKFSDVDIISEWQDESVHDPKTGNISINGETVAHDMVMRKPKDDEPVKPKDDEWVEGWIGVEVYQDEKGESKAVFSYILKTPTFVEKSWKIFRKIRINKTTGEIRDITDKPEKFDMADDALWLKGAIACGSTEEDKKRVQEWLDKPFEPKHDHTKNYSLPTQGKGEINFLNPHGTLLTPELLEDIKAGKKAWKTLDTLSRLVAEKHYPEITSRIVFDAIQQVNQEG